MTLSPQTTRLVAAERFRDLERDAGRQRIARAARAEHASLLSRLRERMPHVPPQQRRAPRPSQA